MRVLVIEDGQEYLEFAENCLGEGFTFLHARSHHEASALLRNEAHIDAFFFDLRFERSEEATLIGDIDGTAKRMFAGDRERARRWIKDQQGALILASLRQAGHKQRAVFIHDFPPERLANLRKLYGDVAAVPDFNASAIRSALQAGRA
jgi:CheY-like chemotaxis protein